MDGSKGIAHTDIGHAPSAAVVLACLLCFLDAFDRDAGQSAAFHGGACHLNLLFHELHEPIVRVLVIDSEGKIYLTVAIQDRERYSFFGAFSSTLRVIGADSVVDHVTSGIHDNAGDCDRFQLGIIIGGQQHRRNRSRRSKADGSSSLARSSAADWIEIPFSIVGLEICRNGLALFGEPFTSATQHNCATPCSQSESNPREWIMSSRRNFFQNVLRFGSGVAALSAAASAQQATDTRSKSGESGHAPHRAVVQTPDVADLPFTIDNGVKVFNLVAEPVKQPIAPGKTLDLWGFNGSAPGPTIQIEQGDRVRILFDNHLPEPTSIHWHGFEIPNDMDGAPGVTQPPVKPGGRFVYEFTLHQEGTYFYHSHMAMQEMFGMLGAFIMHPKTPYEPRVDKDFVILLQEYAVLPNLTVSNSMNMEFNWLVFNGKAGPATTPLIVQLGDRVRIRLINLGMDHHPIHLHGYTFYVTGTEGGRIPKTAWLSGNTVLDAVAQSRDIEFDANNPGNWMLHCHLPHHMMNSMSSTVGPMTRLGRGMPAGVEMATGMGILTGVPGVPLGDDYGPSLGRGLGIGSTNDQPVGNTPLSSEKAKQAMQHEMPGMQHPGMSMSADVAPNANSIPGFPQDAFMEGPMMAMDNAPMVAKPQTHGLPPGWSGFVQGMMTLVRVLPPNEYDKITAEIRKG